MASEGLAKIMFAGRTFVNNNEEGVKDKIRDFMKIPLIKVLGGDLAAVDEKAIVDEIMAGCGSTLPLNLSTQCGNVQMLLDRLANRYFEEMEKIHAVPAVKNATATATGVAPGTKRVLPTPVRKLPPSPSPPIPGPPPPPPARFVCAGINEELVAAKSDVEQIGFPALNSSGDYYEQQRDLASCGRRALNNLLGGKVFDASVAVYDSNATYNLSGITQVQYPIDLHKLCKTLYPDIRAARITDSNLGGYCRRIEYHDINLLNASLEMAGYIPQTQPISDLKEKKPNDPKVGPAYAQLTCEPVNTTLIGFIINYNKNHWVALKKLGENAYKILNSSNAGDNKTITKVGLREYILEPRVQQVIKVLKPADVTYIDPRARLRKLYVDPATVTQAQRDQAAREAFKADIQALLRGMEAAYLGTPEWENYRAMAGILSFAIHNTIDDAQNLQFRHFLELPTFPETVFSNTPAANELRTGLTAAYTAQTNVAENMLGLLEAAFPAAPVAPAPGVEEKAEKGAFLFRIKIPLALLERGGAGAGVDE